MYERHYVYREMNQSQAENETRRLLGLLPRGGQVTLEAIRGLVVLASIGFAVAINAIYAIQGSYGNVIDEVADMLL